MANGKSSDPEPYVIRSGIRYGLKREFIFAIKSQSEHSLSRTRTRSGKTSPQIPPGDSKRVKKSDARDVPSPQTPIPIPIPMEVDNSIKDVVTPIVKKMDSVQAIENEIEDEKKSPRRFTRSALAVHESKPELLPQAPEIDGLKKRTKKKADEGIQIVVEVGGGKSEMERDESPRRLTRSALKSALETPAITTNGGAKEDFSGKSDGTGMLLELEIPVEVVENDGLEALGEIPIVLDACQRSETESNKSPRIGTRSAPKSHAAEESAGGKTKLDSSVLDSEATLTQVMTRRLTRSAASKVISGVSEASTLPPTTVADATGKLVETPIHADDPQGSKIDSGTPQNNGAFSETLAKRLTRSVLKVMPIDFVADEVGISVESPLIVDDQEGPKIENGITEKSSRKFSRLAAKVLKENTSAIVNGDFGLLEIPPTRRCTRSLLKTETREVPAAGESSDTTTGSVGLDESKGWASTDDGLSSVMLTKKMELKMSKKIVLNKLPCNVRELLGTGLLEGLSVMYCAGKQYGLEGVVKGNGILCSCNLCNGFKVVSAYNFELHAGSTKKHPSDFIFLGNGKNLHDILRECTRVPLDMLESAIRNAVGPLPQSKFSLCQKCKESFHTPRTGKFGLLCDSCLLPRLQQQTIVRPSPRTPSNAKLSGKVLAGVCSDGISKNTPSQKKSTISTNFLLEDASDVLSKNTSSQKKIVQGKITRKDVGLHKLVFMDDILPEGTEVGYYICGKRLLEGYIKDSGIYCRCCKSVVSPSQFEAHAGRASRRKPYNNIYTSNGVSLHELSVSLSKDRKLSSNENDDLCSICADGGDLLLCDLCPRAFHKECVGLSSVPKGGWHCRYCHDMHQREKAVGYNDNAIAAGRVAGVDPIEQIIKRYIRIVATSSDFSVCVLCRCHDFSKSGFDQRTVLICDQCEKEYHVGCLKDHGMCDLKELPEGEWFCCAGCSEIHAALHESLLRGLEPLQDLQTEIIKKKHEGKGVSQDAAEVRWRLLSGKTSSDDNKLLLSKAVSIFHESFDPIVDAATGRDLIPSMVYGRSVRDQDFGGMYCAVLTVNSSIVSAGILRVLGCDVAELPLVATSRDSQGQGYFQSLFSCIEKLLEAMKVKHFVLPAAEEARSIWTNKFGFSKISIDQLYEYTKGARPIIFQGTSLLHKRVPLSQSCLQEGRVS